MYDIVGLISWGVVGVFLLLLVLFSKGKISLKLFILGVLLALVIAGVASLGSSSDAYHFEKAFENEPKSVFCKGLKRGLLVPLNNNWRLSGEYFVLSEGKAAVSIEQCVIITK